MKIQLSFIIILFLSAPVCSAISQNILSDERIKIDSIIIRGNEITEDFIILRELNFKAGDSIDSETIDYNRERVFSLGLFSFVDLFIEEDSSSVKLIIDLKESWYIYPIPFLNIRNKQVKQTSYGISLLYKNFRGRNETLQAMVAFGYDPFYFFSYTNPLIFENPDIEFSSSIIYQKPINKSVRAEIIAGESFDYIAASGMVSAGRRLNNFNQVYVYAGYSYVEAPIDNYLGIMASNSNIDRSLLLGVSYVFDTRDLKQFPGRGVLLKGEITNKGLGNASINYNILKIDLREYFTLLNFFTLKWKFAHRHTFGEKVPLYDYSFLGFEDYIRGYRNFREDGNNMLFTSVEANMPLFKDYNLSFKLPLLPKRLTSARIAMYLNLFFDSAALYDNRQEFGFRNFRSGYGFGLVLLVLPFNAIRFEYAFNDFGKGEFLIGSGFSF